VHSLLYRFLRNRKLANINCTVLTVQTPWSTAMIRHRSRDQSAPSSQTPSALATSSDRSALLVAAAKRFVKRNTKRSVLLLLPLDTGVDAVDSLIGQTLTYTNKTVLHFHAVPAQSAAPMDASKLLQNDRPATDTPDSTSTTAAPVCTSTSTTDQSSTTPLDSPSRSLPSATSIIDCASLPLSAATSPRCLSNAASPRMVQQSCVIDTSTQWPRNPTLDISIATVPYLSIYAPFKNHFVREESNNVWDELEDGDWNILLASDSADDFYTVRAATLNKLVQRLTTPPGPGYEANNLQCMHTSACCAVLLPLVD
jgi:hypothetical protein